MRLNILYKCLLLFWVGFTLYTFIMLLTTTYPNISSLDPNVYSKSKKMPNYYINIWLPVSVIVGGIVLFGYRTRNKFDKLNQITPPNHT